MGGEIKAQLCSEFFIIPQKHLSIENKINGFIIQGQSLLLSAEVAENGNFHLVARVRHRGRTVLCGVDRLLEQSHLCKCGTVSLCPHSRKAIHLSIFFSDITGDPSKKR